ncbi:MAG: M20/M25/M40 family metallo-hydrolase, partial [Anaerolineales bacterium]|nr:M20/M25/M40 family metallo-hydrolase [Anaerolineales bacterium]
LGHMDTVAGMAAVREEDNLLYGRGAVDAKGPLATLILAAAGAAPRLKNLRVVVIGAVEEEANSKGSHFLAKTMVPPDMVIIGEPGGWQGITLGYKGTLRIDYHRELPAGHSAGEKPSVAERAVAFWNQVKMYSESLNQEKKRRFDMLDPSLLEIRTAGDGLYDRATMKLGFRLPPEFRVADLRHVMRSWSEGAELDLVYGEPAHCSDKNNPLVKALLPAIRAEGGRPRFVLKTGTSDMNVVGPVWQCPIVAYGPGDSSLDHTPHEHIRIDDYLCGIRVLTRALELLAN